MINIDRLLLRHALTQRYALGFAERFVESWAGSDKAIIAAWREFQDSARKSDFDALLMRDVKNKRVNALIKAIGAVFDEASIGTMKLVNSELSDFIASDWDARAAAIGSTEKAPTASAILAMPILGRSPELQVREFSDNWKKRIISEIVAAQSNGRDVVQALRGTAEQNYRDGIFHTRDNAADADAVNLVNGVSNNSGRVLYKEEGHKREVYFATLDHRTCLRCAPLDNKIFPTGEGAQPPLHPRCRCVRVPYSFGALDAERPFVDDKRPVKNIPKSERAEKIGQTRYSYSEWFERLSDKSKLSILGQSRYDLWKKGDIDLGEFSAKNGGKILNLKDLDDLYGGLD